MDSREDETKRYKDEDKAYSVEKAPGTSIEELLDGIRDKIDQTLNKEQNQSMSSSIGKQ